ncbi:hypothetical protein [Actinomadura vinacea]|uniref:hypothetical protein n=1 Tax=Actinomadura vinacea TaxID=115336 RepID=UPI0031DFD1DF
MGTAAAVGLAVLPGSGGQQAAGRVSNTKAAGLPCKAERFVKNGRFVGTQKTWPNEGAWRVSGWGPDSTLEIRKIVQISNSVSATFGFTHRDISAAVGFDVTKTEATELAHTASLKKKAHYTLRAGAVYKLYKFDIYEDDGHIDEALGRCVPNGRPLRMTTGTAKKFWTLDYRLTKGRKA